MNAENKVDWEIGRLRREISDDWAKLASTDLPASERVAFTEHLGISVSALRELVSRHQTAVQKLKLARFPRMGKLAELSESIGEDRK